MSAHGNSRIEKKVAIAFLAIFAIGLFLTILAFQCYYFPIISKTYSVSPIPQYSANPQGFLFFTSEDVIPNVTSTYTYQIDQINWQEGSAHVAIWVDFYLKESRKGNYTFFALQLFGNVSELEVSFDGMAPELYGTGRATTIYYEPASSSYILWEIPAERVPGHNQIKINFLWKGVFWQRSHYKYALVVSFNSDFPDYLIRAGLPAEAINENGKLLADITQKTSLSIAKPEVVTISDSTPAADKITFYTGKLWYIWDIRERSDSHNYASTAVSVDLEVDSLRIEYDQAFAYFALFLGIGAPLFISSIVELLKLYASSRRVQNDESQLAAPSYSGRQRADRDEYLEVGSNSVDARFRNRMDKLDSLFLMVASFTGAGFTVFVAYLHVPLVSYLPVFVLIAYSLAIGYVHGAIFNSSLTERIRGWTYFLFGLSIYIPTSVLKFGEPYFQSNYPGYSTIAPYLQTALGVALPLAFFVVNYRWALPKLYQTFKVARGEVTKRILEKTYVNALCFGFALFILFFALNNPTTDYSSTLLNIAMFTLFLLPIVSEEAKTRSLLKLEKYQQCVRITRVGYKRRLKIAMSLLLTGFGAFVILWQGLTVFIPFLIALLFYAVIAPILGLIILLFHPGTETIKLDYGAKPELTSEEMNTLWNLARVLDKNVPSPPPNVPCRLSNLYE